jgi:hypothetical protein
MNGNDTMESKEQSGYFRFADDAKAFVKKIKSASTSSGAFDTQFSFYTLCCLLGLAAAKKDPSLPEAPSSGTEMTSDWQGPSRHHQVLIRSLLMQRYLESMGYPIGELAEEDAGTIETAMDTFLQSTGSRLTNKGMKKMDAYAQKGWDLIKEHDFHEITDLALFLTYYVELLQEYSNG